MSGLFEGIFDSLSLDMKAKQIADCREDISSACMMLKSYRSDIETAWSGTEMQAFHRNIDDTLDSLSSSIYELDCALECIKAIKRGSSNNGGISGGGSGGGGGSSW